MPPRPSAHELDLRRLQLEATLGPVTLDTLAGDWQLFQRRKGYRYSTDDLLTAWYAIEHAPARVDRLLDLGIGIGCVGLACAWHFERAHLTGVEAQETSLALLEANVWANGVEHRVDIRPGDLREVTLAGRFELITASPPYFPPETGLLPSDAQAAHCRFELRGDIADYCAAAARVLASDGRFVFCFPSAQEARASSAIRDAGLALIARREIVPRVGAAPLFSLFACGWPPAEATVEPPLVVRDASGARTEAMEQARARLGMAVKPLAPGGLFRFGVPP